MRLLPLLVLLAAPASPPAPVELKPFDPVDTVGGKLVRREVPGEEKALRLILNDQVVYSRDGSLELAEDIPQTTSAGADAVLVAVGSDVPAEKACTHYLFVLVPPQGAATTTAELGDCTDRFTVEREGTTVTVRFADSGQAWALTDGVLAPVPAEPTKAAKGKSKHGKARAK